MSGRDITSLDQVTEYPLTWPQSKPRCAQRKRSLFEASLAKAHKEVENEMSRWRVGSAFVVSMAPAFKRTTTDPGVALWFSLPLKRGQASRELRVIACDSYDLQEHNLYAIAKTLYALRAIERWGAYTLEQAVEGARPMLPPPTGMGAQPWWDVLGVASNWPLEAIEMKYQALAKRAHPDSGGSVDGMAKLNAAIETARRELTA
jgi:hypothetical protein